MKENFNLMSQERFNSEGKTVSSLLVPAKLIPVLKRLTNQKNLCELLAELLKKHRFLFISGNIPFSKNVKLEYQKEGQNLEPIRFRPWLRDWMELGVLAYSLGYSRCLLFSFLLELEDSLFGEIFSQRPFRAVVATMTRCLALGQWSLRAGRNVFIRTQRFYRNTG
jgi:hypothetical protein